VAREVAEQLGYACLSKDIVLDASEIFHIAEPKLFRALHDAPSLMERFTREKEPCVAYVRAALLKFLQEDDVVYHGLAGHFFIRDLPHVLKVRIIADLEDRIRLEMERNRVSREVAGKAIAQDDTQRRKWSRYMFGIDTADPSLYDLVIHIQDISISDAASIICHTVRMPRFQTTQQGLKAIRDLALAAEIQATLRHMLPTVHATADNGKVVVTVKLGEIDTESVIREINQSVAVVKGVRSVEVKTEPLIVFSE